MKTAPSIFHINAAGGISRRQSEDTVLTVRIKELSLEIFRDRKMLMEDEVGYYGLITDNFYTVLAGLGNYAPFVKDGLRRILRVHIGRWKRKMTKAFNLLELDCVADKQKLEFEKSDFDCADGKTREVKSVPKLEIGKKFGVKPEPTVKPKSVEEIDYL